MEDVGLVKWIHIISVALSVSLFIVRYRWQYLRSPQVSRPWVRVVPHVNDTVLLVSGVTLMVLSGSYPWTEQGTWLTEKLFGVIIYIVLGFIALGRGSRNQHWRLIAFLLALVVLYIIIKLATTQIPLPGIV